LGYVFIVGKLVVLAEVLGIHIFLIKSLRLIKIIVHLTVDFHVKDGSPADVLDRGRNALGFKMNIERLLQVLLDFAQLAG